MRITYRHQKEAQPEGQHDDIQHEVLLVALVSGRDRCAFREGRLRWIKNDTQRGDEIDRLIRFLDKTDDYVSRELEDSIDDSPHDEETDDNGEDNEDDGLSEPSLGSVGDAHFDQQRWAAGCRRDLEQDDGESGIADQDGVDEQVPFRDWQGVGMV